MDMNKRNLQHRAYQFSLDIIDFLQLLPKTYVYQVIGKQLLRSATSIGANIIEAQAGKTRNEFVNFYHIALKSANETRYWLLILREKLLARSRKEKVEKLLKEVVEIGNMLGASLLTLKSKKP
jgi:four helix bundle protein